MQNQTFSTILNGRKPLMINNMMSSKNTFYISWFFGNGFEKEKNPNMAFGVTFHSFNSWFSINKSSRMTRYLLYIFKK
jgi:hypothetical protein